MYLVSVLDDQPVIEASLGGRVDILEMRTFAEDLEDMFDNWQSEPFYLLLDYSKAASFDQKTIDVLNALKEKAFEEGCVKIFSIPNEDTEMEDHVSGRMQDVLYGREEFLAHSSQAAFAPVRTVAIAKAA